METPTKNEALEVLGLGGLVALGTINEDGSPYVTPVFASFDGQAFFWKSSPEARHSKNIARDVRVSLSLVENTAKDQRAVYVSGQAILTGKTTVDEKWQQKIFEFTVPLGEFDEQHSTPGRFYFKAEETK